MVSVVARDLTTNGREVVRLVRHERAGSEVRWDPDGGTIDFDDLEDFDGLVDVATTLWPSRRTSVATKRIYDHQVGSYLQADYAFRLPELEAALRHQLGPAA